ncbi:mucin-2-like [Penaeus chinensis]|uniref:mucin-2-like n=1 Tax=Penaeus chinensis TaxID=139456 RepID=UPI001FB613B8|nr:mucin-2-like [Penaeus chinensis]
MTALSGSDLGLGQFNHRRVAMGASPFRWLTKLGSGRHFDVSPRSTSVKPLILVSYSEPLGTDGHQGEIRRLRIHRFRCDATPPYNCVSDYYAGRDWLLMLSYISLSTYKRNNNYDVLFSKDYILFPRADERTEDNSIPYIETTGNVKSSPQALLGPPDFLSFEEIRPGRVFVEKQVHKSPKVTGLCQLKLVMSVSRGQLKVISGRSTYLQTGTEIKSPFSACPATVTFLMVVLSVTAASGQWSRSYSQPYNQRYHPSYYRYPPYGYRFYTQMQQPDLIYPTRQPVYQVRNTPTPSEKRHDTGRVLFADVAESSLSSTDATSIGSMVTTMNPATSTGSLETTMSPVITSSLTTTTKNPTEKPVTTISTTSSTTTTTTTTTIASPTEGGTKDTSPTSTASSDQTGTNMNVPSATENDTQSTVTPADIEVNQTSSTTPIFQPFTMRPVHFILQHQENEDKQLKVDTLATSAKQANEHIQENFQREKTDEMTHLSNVKFSISEPVKVCCDNDDDDEMQKSDHTSEKSDVLVNNTSNDDKIPETEGTPESTTEKPDLQKFFFSNLFGPGGFLGRPRPQYQSRPVPLTPPIQRPQKQSDQQYQQATQRKTVQQKIPVKPIETTPISLHQPTSRHPQKGQPQHYNRPHVIQPAPTRPSQTLPQRPPFAYSRPPKLPVRIPRPTIRAPSGQLLKQVAGPVLGPAPGVTWIPSSDIPNRPAAIQPDSALTWVPANLPDRQDNSDALLFVDEDQPAKQINNDTLGTDVKLTVPTPVLESENKDTTLVLAKDEVKHFVPETIIPSEAESVTPPSSEHKTSSSKQLENVDEDSGMSQKQIENTASATLSLTENENISPVPKAVTALRTHDEIQEQPDVQLVEDALIPRNAGDAIKQPVADVITGQFSKDISDTLITDPVENTPVQAVRIVRLPFRPPFPPDNETQSVRVPITSAQSFRQSVRKPPRQRPPPTGFFQFQRPPPSSAKPATPARPIQLLSTLSVQPSPLQTPIQPPRQRSPVQPPPLQSPIQRPPPRSPVQPQLSVRTDNAPPTPLSSQPKQPAPHSDPRLSTQSTSHPLISRPSAQTQPFVANIENKSDAPTQGVLPQFNPASGLQFTLIKPSEISDENNNRDISPQFNPEIGTTFAGEIKANRNRSTTVQSVLEDIVQISKPDPFRIISGPSLSNQSSSNNQPPEAELPPSVPEEQVFLPAITVVSSVNFNKQSPIMLGSQNLSEEKATAINEETTELTLPVMNIFDIVPITNSPVETNTLSEVTPLPSSVNTTIPVLNTTTVIPEVITEAQPSSTTEKSSTHTVTEANAKPKDHEVVFNKHSNSNITNILAGGFQLISSDDVTEMQKVENSSKKEVLSLAGPGPMKPIPLDSPQQSFVDEENTLKPGSVPLQPIQIPEIDDLEDDLDAVVSYVALLHRAVPPLNRKPTIEPSKGSTEKKQELPKPTTPQLPVHIRPIPSGAFIPGIGLSKRPGAVPIRINNLSNLPPDAILVRRPGPPPQTLQARPGPPPPTLQARPGPPPPTLQARPGPPPPTLQARPGPPPPTLQARPGPPPTLLARPGPPPTLLARPGPPTQQTRPGPPPPTIQTNVHPLSNGQFRPGIIFTLDEAGTPHFSPLPPRPQPLPPQPPRPETQSQSQALPERQKISSSGQKPDDSSLRQPADDQPPSNVETQTFVRPTQSQEVLASEVPEGNDNSQSSLITLEITGTKPTSQPSELFSAARPTSHPNLQRPELLPLPTRPVPLKPETPPPPVKPVSESPKTKPVILIPTIQKTETDLTPQNLETRPPPQSPILQRPESQLLQRPSPQRPEVLLSFQPISQTSEAQSLRPFPQRPESRPPSPAPQTIAESQPQRPETKLPQLILQRPTLQRPGILPPIQRPPLKRPQTLQRPEVPPADMLPPPRPFPGFQPRPETTQRRPDTQPAALRPQFLARPPTGPFFRPGVPTESSLRRPVVSTQFQPSQPTIPFSQGKLSFQETLKPQLVTDDFRPITPSPEIPLATENEQPQSNQFVRGDNQKLIDDIIGSLPDFLKGSVKIDHTNLGPENTVSVSNSYGNVIYQKRGITYIDQVQ